MRVRKLAERVLLPVIPMVIITLAAEIVVRAGLVQSFLVPTPSSDLPNCFAKHSRLNASASRLEPREPRMRGVWKRRRSGP